MADEGFRVLELSLQGFKCSQILTMLALEAQGKEDPLLVRSMSGLLGGLGCGTKTCGALTGGCCVLGLYAGRGSTDEQEDGNLPIMLSELVDWFDEQYGNQYGGTNCNDITERKPELRLSRCPQMVIDTYKKVVEILGTYDYSMDGQTRAEHE